MKLDRNDNGERVPKYAVINMRKWRAFYGGAEPLKMVENGCYSIPAEFVEWGEKPEEEAFVIKLRDVNAEIALTSYGLHSLLQDSEYGQDVLALSRRAGRNHPLCKNPD